MRNTWKNAAFEALKRNRLTLAAAESLTAGAVCAKFCDLPGASEILQGGVTVYATHMKAKILGVDQEVLTERGPVDREVAIKMACSVADLFEADMAVSTTGVAGPGMVGNTPAGTVHIAGVLGSRIKHELHHFSGDRSQVREHTVNAVFRLIVTLIEEANKAGELGHK